MSDTSPMLIFRRAAVLALVLAAASGCASDPPPMVRTLDESAVRAFTDRVLVELRNDPDPIVHVMAQYPDKRGDGFPSSGYRAGIESVGRDVCSHMIAGTAPGEAYQAAYRETPDGDSRVIVRQADAVLCPLRPAD